jgi:hypothetical protein
MPVTEEDAPIGGLCGLIVGYIEKNDVFITMVARGENWGDKGYIYIPTNYIENSGETYTIRIQEELVQLEVNSPIASRQLKASVDVNSTSIVTTEQDSSEDNQSTMSIAF